MNLLRYLFSRSYRQQIKARAFHNSLAAKRLTRHRRWKHRRISHGKWWAEKRRLKANRRVA